MAQLTKSQLLSELEAARVEIQRLATENESLRLDLGRARSHAQRSSLPRRVYTPRITSEQQLAHDNYARALLAAREEAARTGRTAIVRRPA